MSEQSFGKFFNRVAQSKRVGMEATRDLWACNEAIQRILPIYKEALLKAANSKK
jgi:hypothetical protein